MESIKNLYFRGLFILNRLFSLFYPYRAINFKGGSFKLKAGTNDEFRRVFTFKDKEPETLKWINEFIKVDGESDLVFYDIGANIGIYSLYAASRFPSAKILAFEPDSQSFSSLAQNIHVNKLNILPYPFAINDLSGIGKVLLSSMSAGAGACSLSGKYLFSSTDQTFEQGVFFVSLDDLVYKYNFPLPNYIKIDVDGIEGKILKGASSLLKSNQVRGILVELQYIYDDDTDKIIDNLNSYGFELVGKSDWISSFNEWKSRNFLFSKRCK